MRHRREAWREWTARLAALVFAVHAVLIAFSAGATAGTVTRDQFGNVICAPDAGGRHSGSPAHDRHDGGFPCCTAGCPMLGGLAPSPAADAVSLARPDAAPVRFALRENVAAAGVPPSPRSARAPPLPL